MKKLFRGKVIYAPSTCTNTYTGGQWVIGSLLIWSSGEHEICVSVSDTEMDKLTVDEVSVGSLMYERDDKQIFEDSKVMLKNEPFCNEPYTACYDDFGVPWFVIPERFCVMVSFQQYFDKNGRGEFEVVTDKTT